MGLGFTVLGLGFPSILGGAYIRVIKHSPGNPGRFRTGGLEAHREDPVGYHIRGPWFVPKML